LVKLYNACALCNQKKDLKKSHIVPKFVGKWIKDTSATGILRGVVDPDTRRQDLPTVELLCEDCEQIFSKLESYFASNVFYPFLKDDIEVVTYDENLMRFIISLSWRTLKLSYEDQIKYSPWIKKYLDVAEGIWRKYLLQLSSDSGPYEHHILFLDYIEKGPDMPNKFQWYTLRGTDATIVSNKDTVYIYTHFPWMFFISSIYPINLSGWKGTKIKNSGKITKNFSIEDARFGNFLIHRSRLILNITEGSLDDRILKSLEKNPEKFLISESFNVMIAEAKRERQENRKKLPRGINALINIIDRSLEIPELNPLQQKWITFTQHIIADKLVSISLEKALEIHSLLESAIRNADITQPDIQCDFETDDIIGRFMVTFCGTKNEQRRILNKSLKELLKKRKKNDERFIIVFSFNPLEGEIPFETAYHT